MQLELITLLGEKVNEPIYEVVLPTLDGEIGVFPGHESLVGVAVPGALMVRRHKGDKEVEYFAISGGVIEISKDRVRVLVDEADAGDDIIEAESKKALDDAIRLRDQTQDRVELEKADQLVDKHAVRLKVAELHRRHHH
jgi:F-type H+-transporting ATPase subunit epsilon